MVNISWTERANCKGKTKYFFPSYSERPQAARRRIEKAKIICAECEVSKKCRDYGRDNGEVGIWGGETDEERHVSGFPTADPTIKRRIAKKATREQSRTR